LIWDKTLVALPIKTDVDSKIMSQISEASTKDNFPYFTAASYYLDNKKDIYKALEWFNKAVEQNPKAFFMFYQKARCLAKMGRNKEAIATAQQSIQLAKEAKNDDYVTLNEKLIATLK
jgi:tetratricopeptide (TPR) repeat protein